MTAPARFVLGSFPPIPGLRVVTGAYMHPPHPCALLAHALPPPVAAAHWRGAVPRVALLLHRAARTRAAHNL